MTELLLALDRALFCAINRSMGNPLFDHMMPIVTSFQWWIPVFALGLAWLLLRGQKRGRWCGVLMILVVAVSDPLTNRVIKPLIERERPCHRLTCVVQRIPCPEGPSFPSSHAVNMAAIAVVLSCFYRRLWWMWALAAVIVGFSRVYVGVHYPGDVFFGWILGVTIGLVTVAVTRRWWQ